MGRYGFNFALRSGMGREGAVFGALPYNDGIVGVEAVSDFLLGVGAGFRPPAFPRRRSVKKIAAYGIVINDKNVPGGAVQRRFQVVEQAAHDRFAKSVIDENHNISGEGRQSGDIGFDNGHLRPLRLPAGDGGERGREFDAGYGAKGKFRGHDQRAALAATEVEEVIAFNRPKRGQGAAHDRGLRSDVEVDVIAHCFIRGDRVNRHQTAGFHAVFFVKGMNAPVVDVNPEAVRSGLNIMAPRENDLRVDYETIQKQSEKTSY